MATLIDTHCHLNFQAFRGREAEVVVAAQAAGVGQLVVVGTNLATSQRAVALAEQFEGVFASVGLHPHHVFAYQGEVDIEPFRKLAAHPKVVAIGEVGLDRHHYAQTKYQDYQVDDSFLAAQNRWLVAQLRLAVELHKALIIHNRAASDELLDQLNTHWSDSWRQQLVLHCCEADQRWLDFALERQVFIGVDADVLSDPIKQDFIRQVPIENLVLETDAPFFPLPGNKMSTPADLVEVARQVAQLKNVTVSELEKQTTQNAVILFGLPSFFKNSR